MTRLSRLSRSIEGRVAIVTGAASGMGRATAHLFADEGAMVAVTDIQAEGVERVVAEIEAAGGSARGWQLDVGDGVAITRVAAEVQRNLGDVDILINNAGIGVGGPIDAPGYEEQWQRSLDVMLTAHVRLIRACLDQLRRRGQGRIVNVASTEALGATALTSPYTVAKHGVVGLTRSLAIELGEQGVTVNCICPGAVHTGLTQFIDADAKRKFARRRVPLRRYGDPEEVAHLILALVLPSASYITGAVVPVDGGLTIQNT